MKKEFIAHVKKNPDDSWAEPHYLDNHLNSVAKKAGEFAAEFGNQDWGELYGYWHDLGKFLPAWQKYIRRESGYDVNAHIEGSNNRPNHRTAGAVFAFDSLNEHVVARLAAYGIGGHHAGLPDWYPDDAGGDLQNRIYKNPIDAVLDTEEIEKIRQIPEAKEFLEKDFPKSAPTVIRNKEHLHLWVRMLFSCLVDADFLDTEKYINPRKTEGTGRLSYTLTN